MRWSSSMGVTTCIATTSTSRARRWRSTCPHRRSRWMHASTRAGRRGNPRWAGARSVCTSLQRRANTPADFAIVLDHFAEVAAKAILVHLLAGLRVPEAAPVGREFVAEHDRTRRRIHGMPELQLVIDEVDAAGPEQRREHGV